MFDALLSSFSRLKALSQTTQLLRVEESGRYLPRIVAIMIYLMALSLMAFFLVQSHLDHWQQDLRGSLTVQILPVTGESTNAFQQRVDKALTQLDRASVVKEARRLELEETRDLLAVWLDVDTLPQSLPLPAVIDVTLISQESEITVAAVQDLEESLQTSIGAVAVDDHRVWLQNMRRTAGSVAWGVALIIVLIAIAALAVVALATRTDMALNRRTIEILHNIGARDSLIARQFALKSFVASVWGAVLGLGLTMVTLLVLLLVLPIFQSDAFMGAGGLQLTWGSVTSSLDSMRLLIMLGVPVLAGIAAAIVSGMTVRKVLLRMV